ncbi:MAG: aminopeptidase P N-terminal domain-containing protein [Bacteroidota bacterium]
MRLIAILFLFLFQFAGAQEPKYYRYDNDILSKDFHKGRREALREKMPVNSVAVIFAAPERLYSNDNDYQYHQSPDFYYLTGFLEPNSMLLVLKTPIALNGMTSDEFLFVPDRNPERESWNGRRAGKEGANDVTGVHGILLAADFDSLKIDFSTFDKLWYILPKGAIDNASEGDDLYSLIESFKKKCSYPPANGDVGGLSASMSELREIKLPEEIELMRKAIRISCEGHNEIMRAIIPGMHEYEVQAIGEYVWKREGSEFVGYPSICGGGENSCILHYEANRKPLASGDIQLNDMGAEYHGYSADVTRTIPVNGKFSPEQKQIYQLVYDAQQAGFEACVTGNEFRAAHKAAVSIIGKGLVDLGITKTESDYKNYFFHGTSHYLGLDVHDAGTSGKLKPGVVLTVEPGIYIPEGSPCDPKWWNIGVRIEDDILVTENGYENLSEASPRTIEAVEALMKEKPVWIKEK